MGLRAFFTMADLGYPEETPIMNVVVDYSSGCDVFADTFEREAKNLCPIDTGRLFKSIQGASHGEGCECIANTEYAQYVEYGTCYMADQPYFEPAIGIALDEAIPYWEGALQQAEEEEEELIEEAQAAKAKEATKEGEKGAAKARQKAGSRTVTLVSRAYDMEGNRRPEYDKFKTGTVASAADGGGVKATMLLGMASIVGFIMGMLKVLADMLSIRGKGQKSSARGIRRGTGHLGRPTVDDINIEIF